MIKKLKIDNKGQVFGNLQALFVGLATIAIITAVVFLILAQSKTQLGSIEGIDVTNATQCASSVGCNATNTITSSVQDAVNFVPLIVIAAIGAVLLGLVALFRRRQ